MNLRLGTTYLKLVLDDFGGSSALAAAAYNAGPGRPRRWREGPSLEPAAWAESIPFNETRDYVKKVLSNATVYAGILRPEAPLSLGGRWARSSARARPARPPPTGSCHEREGSAMSLARIVVLGGSGFVGRATLAQLVARSGGGGERLVVPTRRLAQVRAIQSLPTVEPLQADVHDDAQLQRLLAGADAVVNLVAILHGSQAAFEHVHVTLPRRLAAACRAAGVGRLVHVSALGVAADAPSRYLRSKAAGEEALRASGIGATVLRPSVIFRAEDRFLNLFAAMQAFAPVVPLAGAAARFQPVWVEDVARAIVACLAPAIYRRPDPRVRRPRGVHAAGPGAPWPAAWPGTSGRCCRCPARWRGCRRPCWSCCRASR
jgi:uncharacterized protein YbjT (DUF2867 family)